MGVVGISNIFYGFSYVMGLIASTYRKELQDVSTTLMQ
jgi:hypothetical protein